MAIDFNREIRIPHWRIVRMIQMLERMQIELGALAELCEKVLTDLRSAVSNNEPLTFWYMRDNHTFLPLPLNEDRAIQKIKDAIHAGSVGGMLCAGSEYLPELGVVHAGDMTTWPDFEAKARAWIRTALEKHNGSGLGLQQTTGVP